MLAKIETVLDEKVRPQLTLHGGDVKTISYQDNILHIKLLGQCSGCPSAYLTTEELIKAEIMNALPEVQDVVLVHEVSEELLDIARQFLSRKEE